MPKVSICIPTYKQIVFLKKCLISISEQSFNDYELIISDDSPDDSVYNLIRQFNFGAKLKYIKNSRPLGSPANWNFAINHASGDLIKLMHHDDRFYDARSLQKFVSLMNENPTASFAFSSSEVRDVINNKNWTHTATPAQVDQIKTFPELLITGNLIGSPSATIYKRDINLEYDNNLKWLVDIDFYIRAIQKNCNIVNTKETLVETPTNASHQVTESCKNNCNIELFEYSILFLKNREKVNRGKCIENHLLGVLAKYRIFSEKKLQLPSHFSPEQINLLRNLVYVLNKRPIVKLLYCFYWSDSGPIFLQKTTRFFIHKAYNFLTFVRFIIKKLQNRHPINYE